MNVKLKKRDSAHRKALRKKLEQLSILTEEFLEESFSEDPLAKDWKQMARLKTVLLNNLWQGNIDPDDPDYNPETPNEFAKMLLYFHKLLTEGFWEDFKKHLKHAKRIKGPIKTPAGTEEYKELIDRAGTDEMDVFINIQAPQSAMTVRCCFDIDSVHFYRSSIDAIPALLDLLQGLPWDNLRFCENTECQRFIVQTTGHKRKFCSNRCQARQRQREFRKKDPEGFKKYHRNYYHKRKQLGEKKRKTAVGFKFFI